MVVIMSLQRNFVLGLDPSSRNATYGTFPIKEPSMSTSWFKLHGIFGLGKKEKKLEHLHLNIYYAPCLNDVDKWMIRGSQNKLKVVRLPIDSKSALSLFSTTSPQKHSKTPLQSCTLFFPQILCKWFKTLSIPPKNLNNLGSKCDEFLFQIVSWWINKFETHPHPKKKPMVGECQMKV
jgi:hypothetical protein